MPGPILPRLSAITAQLARRAGTQLVGKPAEPGIIMTKRCCGYSFVFTRRPTRAQVNHLTCPRSRYQALTNRLSQNRLARLGGPGLVLGSWTLPVTSTAESAGYEFGRASVRRSLTSVM